MNAPSFEDLLERIASVSQEFLPKYSTVATHSNVYSQNQTSWKLDIDSFGKSISSTDQKRYIQSVLDKINLSGPIQMKHPDLLLMLSFDCGHIGEGRFPCSPSPRDQAGLLRPLRRPWTAHD